MLGFPSASVVKTLPANAGDTGSIPGSGSFPAEGNGDLLQCSCLGSPKDRRSPAGHSPRGHRRVRHTLGTKSRQQLPLTAGQRNRRESTEINPHAHDQLTVSKGGQEIQYREEEPLRQVVLQRPDSHANQ